MDEYSAAYNATIGVHAEFAWEVARQRYVTLKFGAWWCDNFQSDVECSCYLLIDQQESETL